MDPMGFLEVIDVTDLIPHMFSVGSETSQRLYPSSPEVFSEKQPSVTTSTVAEVCWWCRENSQLGELLAVTNWTLLGWFFTNPFEKSHDRQIGFIFPRYRGEK